MKKSFAAAHFYDFHSRDEEERATSAPRCTAYSDAANSQRVCVYIFRSACCFRERLRFTSQLVLPEWNRSVIPAAPVTE